MNIQHILLFCCFSGLCVEVAHVEQIHYVVATAAKVDVQLIYRVIEGSSSILHFVLPSDSGTLYFCKNDCQVGDLILQTGNVYIEEGRFKLRYIQADDSYSVMIMTIDDVRKNDEGPYRIAIDSKFPPHLYVDFRLEVVAADEPIEDHDFIDKDVHIFEKTVGDDFKFHCYFPSTCREKYLCKGECDENLFLVKTRDEIAQNGKYSLRSVGRADAALLQVTIEGLTKHDSGLYTFGRCEASNSSPSCMFEIRINEASEQLTVGWADILLPLDAALSALVLLLIILLIVIQRRSSRNPGMSVAVKMNTYVPPDAIYDDVYQN